MLVAGVGGIGCLLSEILVRAGVGKIHLCDNGIVDPPDLNRQLFYVAADVGRPKIEVAAERLLQIHGRTRVVSSGVDVLSADFTFPPDVDVVADCLDNFAKRFAFWHKIPDGTAYVHAGVEQFFGQVLSLKVGELPSLENIFGNADTRERIVPVSAVSASTLGALAAGEVIHNIFGVPKLLRTILVVDLSDFSFEKIAL